MDVTQAGEQKPRRIIGARRHTVDVAQQEPVTIEATEPGRRGPLVIRPATDQADLAEWVASGAIAWTPCSWSTGPSCCAGSRSATPPTSRRSHWPSTATCTAITATCRASGISGRIYDIDALSRGPDDPVPQRELAPARWPMRIGFACLRPPSEGGATPLLDCRAVYRAIDPAVFEQFATKGRDLHPQLLGRAGRPWQEFFHTDDRARS